MSPSFIEARSATVTHSPLLLSAIAVPLLLPIGAQFGLRTPLWQGSAREVLELDGFIRERGWIDRKRPLDQHPRKPHIARIVDGHGGNGLPFQELEEGEGRIAWLAAPNDPIPTIGRASHLQIDLVLIGPEPRYFGKGVGAAGDHFGDGDALILCILPRLEADMSAQQRVEMSRNVASRENRGVAGPTKRVDDDAVANLEAGSLG